MNIVIIGGVAAGAKAAAKTRRLLPNADIKLFTQDTHVSYSSCGLPYYIQGNIEDYRSLLVRSPEEFGEQNIEIHLETRVEKIIPKVKSVLVITKDGAELVKYDKLIIATGARPFLPSIKGIHDFKNIYTVRTIEDGINIRNKLRESKRCLIIGSGYIGLEILEAMSKNGVYADVVEVNSHIIPIFDDDISSIIKQRLESIPDRNFKFHTGEPIIEFVGENGLVTTAKTSKGEEIPTDMVVISAGVVPNVKIAQDAGIALGKTGAIKVDKLMRTSIEDIYACGDCAQKTHIVSGQEVWIPLGSTANKEGRCAAINAAGGYCEFEGVLGSAVIRCLNTTMAMTGLTEKEAIEVGYTPISAIVNKYDKVAYMPDATEMTLKVIADKVTGLLLGAQAIGSPGADKRVNSLTAALIGHLTVEEFSRNDFTYSPPYSTTIDPMLNAMQILCTKTTRRC